VVKYYGNFYVVWNQKNGIRTTPNFNQMQKFWLISMGFSIPDKYSQKSENMSTMRVCGIS